MNGVGLRSAPISGLGGTVLCWAITTATVFLGAVVGVHVVVKADEPLGFLDSLARIDGRNYRHIIENGYEYQDKDPSSVAFFPAFPLASGCLARLSRLGAVPAMLIVSNTCCSAAFVLMGAYLQRRLALAENVTLHDVAAAADSGLGGRSAGAGHVASYALLAMGVLPTTFFFRMAYTESMFLCLALATLYAIARRWPPIVVALIVGLATASRPVAISLLLPAHLVRLEVLRLKTAGDPAIGVSHPRRVLGAPRIHAVSVREIRAAFRLCAHAEIPSHAPTRDNQ